MLDVFQNSASGMILVQRMCECSTSMMRGTVVVLCHFLEDGSLPTK